jgi:hypothetical protein
MNRVNSDDVPPKLSYIPMSHFSATFSQTRSRIPIRINSTSNITSRFSFQGAQMNHNERRSLVHRKLIVFNKKIAHDPNWTRCFFSFKEAAISSPIWRMVPIISFSWRYRFGYHTRIEKSTSMHLMHHVLILWRRQNTTLTTATETSVVWSKTCRFSSVVGASSGRQSRLNPAFSTLQSLNDLIIFTHD